jgi:hypothetical protein
VETEALTRVQNELDVKGNGQNLEHFAPAVGAVGHSGVPQRGPPVAQLSWLQSRHGGSYNKLSEARHAS